MVGLGVVVGLGVRVAAGLGVGVLVARAVEVGLFPVLDATCETGFGGPIRLLTIVRVTKAPRKKHASAKTKMIRPNVTLPLL